MTKILEVVSTEDILPRSSFEIFFFIGIKEVGRHGTENSWNVSAVSSFQQQKNKFFNVEDKSKDGPCQGCEKLFSPFKRKRTQNVKSFRYCLSC